MPDGFDTERQPTVAVVMAAAIAMMNARQTVFILQGKLSALFIIASRFVWSGLVLSFSECW
jgi:hypothetical protein